MDETLKVASLQWAKVKEHNYVDVCTLPKNAAELFEAGLVLIQG